MSATSAAVTRLHSLATVCSVDPPTTATPFGSRAHAATNPSSALYRPLPVIVGGLPRCGSPVKFRLSPPPAPYPSRGVRLAGAAPVHPYLRLLPPTTTPPLRRLRPPPRPPLLLLLYDRRQDLFLLAMSLRDHELRSGLVPSPRRRCLELLHVWISKMNAATTLQEENVVKRKSDDVG